MVRALILALVLLLSPAVALAEDGMLTESQPVQIVDNTSLLQNINEGINSINEKLDAEAQERENEKMMREIESVSDPQQQQLDTLMNIDKTLTEISGRDESVQLMEQQPLLAAGNHAFVTYGNVSPTGTYAVYAQGTLAKARWQDDYVYLQDTSSSYVLVWGKLEMADDNTITGTDCNYVRWYYSGNQLGYLTEYGGGNVSVTLNSHVVISNLGAYPMFSDETPLFRREVAFYAVVSVSVFCLWHVWGFTTRLRGAVSVQ